MFTASLGVFLFGLIAAFAGGALGAAIGGNYAFVLVGFALLASWGMFAATGTTIGFDYIAFGPLFGPHVAFAGGAAAAIYARYKGYMEDGKDVNSALAGLGRPDVLFAGAAFGALGHIIQSAITFIPWFGSHTDSVALTVLLSAIIARWMFGGVPGAGLMKGSQTTPELYNDGNGLFGKIAPGDEKGGHWLVYQERPNQLLTIGSLFGIMAGGVSLALASNLGARMTALGFDNGLTASLANTFMFGISAIIILFLISGRNVPVQHHVTNIAGLGAVVFFPILCGDGFAWTAMADWDNHYWMMAIVALILAALFGIMAAFIVEFAARLLYNRGTSHIDPPAAGIWISNTIIWAIAALF